MHYSYFYILANSARNFLYIGATDDLTSTLIEHTLVACSKFSIDARPIHLIYFENFKRVEKAELRANQIRKWRDSQKWKMIMRANPCLHELLWLEAESIAA